MFFEKKLELAKKAAFEAGEAVMHYFKSSNFEIKNKSVNNPVTTADFEANNMIKEILMDDNNSFGWLSEETVDSKERLENENVWVVDPIDGTKEFIEGVPHFSISIGMVRLGKPVICVIYNPAKNELIEIHSNQMEGLKDLQPCSVAVSYWLSKRFFSFWGWGHFQGKNMSGLSVGKYIIGKW